MPQLTTSDAAASDRLSIVLTATPRYVEHSTDGGVDCIKSLKQIADSLIDKVISDAPVTYRSEFPKMLFFGLNFHMIQCIKGNPY